MGEFTQSFAQSGNSCSTPIALGTLKDSTYRVTFNYPDTVKWISFNSDSSLVSFLASSNKDSIGFVKIKELNIYNTSCTSVTSNIPHSYPGKTAAIIRRANLTTNQTYLLKLVRHYSISLNDTANRDVFFNFRGGISTGQCIEGLCNNLVYDGGFENHITPLSNGAFLEDLYCWTFAEPGGEIPVYFSEYYTSQLFKIPNQNCFGSGINLPTQFPDPDFFPNSNTGYIGINTNQDNSDIAQGFLSTYLNPNTLYFASYIVSPGKSYSAGYHDRIDLDILHYSNIGNYDTAVWGANYAAKTPAVQSGVIDFSQPWTRVSNVFTSGPTIGESIIYIGNLAQQPYTTPIIGAAQSYYVDNLIIKPFELNLGPDIVACQGQIVDITVPCQYLYPGATYTWTSTDPNFLAPTNNESNLSFTATAAFSYTLSITVTNPQGGFEIISDIINISIAPAPTIGINIGGGPQGTYCKYDGVLYVVQGNQVSLTASGAGASGTYDWYVNGTLTASNQSYFFTPGLAPVGDYQIVVIGTDSLCSGSDTINVTIVNNRCKLPCNTVLGQSAFVDQFNNLTNYTIGARDYVNTSAPNFNSLPFTGPNLTYVVDGTFTINSGASVTFTDVTILISPGGKIINKGELNLVHCVVDACEQMWDRIDNFGSLAVYNNSNINHAEAAIELRANSYTKISGSTFTNNIVGVFSRDLVNSNNRKTLNYFSIAGTTFQGVGIIPATMRFTSQYSQYTGLATGNAPLDQPPFYLKPANGINIRAVAAINIGYSSNNTLPNQFINMWNGIAFNNTSGIITNCRFEGMEANANHAQLRNNPMVIEPQDIILTTANPNYSTHYKDIVTNAISSINSTLHLFSLDNDSDLNPTVMNCFRGVSNLYGDLNTTPLTPTDYMYFRDVNTGVRTEGILNTRIVTLNRLNIESNNYGFVSLYNNPGSTQTISNNNFFPIKNTTVSGTCQAINYRDIGNFVTTDITANTPIRTCNITNNFIQGEGALYGIEIWNGTDANIANNIIELNASPVGQVATTGYKGIFINNCYGADVTCNTIDDNTGLTTAQQSTNAAIDCFSSPNTILTCNSTQRFRKGISMREICEPSVLSANTLGDHFTGLYYEANTTVGVQNHRGNLWTGVYTNGAFFNGTPSYILLSGNEYKVDTVVNPDLLPSPITPNTGWFYQLDSNGLTENCVTINCAPGNMREEEGYAEQLIQMANITNDSTLYGMEIAYYTKSNLYKELANNDSIRDEDYFLKQTFDSLNQTNLSVLDYIQTNISQIYCGTETQALYLRELTESKNQFWQLWVSATLQEDSINAANYASDLNVVMSSIDNINVDIHSVAISRRSAALEMLNGFSPVNLMEQNLKDVLTVYLNYVFDDGIEDLSTQEALLASIAYQCPLAGGDGVHIARALFMKLYPEAFFNDEAICNADAGRRQTQQDLILAGNNFNQTNTLVYPNPSNGIINIATGRKIISFISINDLAGRSVLSPKLLSNQTIDCTSLEKGIYLLEISYQNSKSETFKINIVK